MIMVIIVMIIMMSMRFPFQGGDINMKTKDGMTPLILACSKGLLETVDFLLNNGAQISQADNLMRNALHWAVENAHLEVLLYLLKVNRSKRKS